MTTEKEVQAALVASGAMDPTEVPFDETENVAPEVTDEFEIPHTLSLNYPIEFNKQPVKEIVFKNYPQTSACLHLKVLDPMSYQYGHFVPIISACCGVPDLLIKSLIFPDFRRAVEYVTRFLLSSGE